MNTWQDLHKHYLKEIKNLVSCPGDLFQALYVATLDNLLTLCETLPFSETSLVHPHDFLKRQMQLAVATLKLRRGLFFPVDADIEVIAAEEPQWTYALFSAALLRNIDQIITQENGEDRNVSMKNITERIVPAIAMRWISENQFLQDTWQQAILHQPNAISAVIEKGMLLSGITPLTTPVLSKSKYSDAFMFWLANRTEGNSDHIFQTENGLFVSKHMMNKYISDQENITEMSLIDELKLSGKLVKGDANNWHSFSPKKFEDRRVIEGILFNNGILSVPLLTVPFNHQYQKNIIL